MDGENNGKPYFLMDDLGVPLFLETPIYLQKLVTLPILPRFSQDCLRAWANPKSIGYPPWRKGNLETRQTVSHVLNIPWNSTSLSFNIPEARHERIPSDTEVLKSRVWKPGPLRSLASKKGCGFFWGWSLGLPWVLLRGVLDQANGSTTERRTPTLSF